MKTVKKFLYYKDVRLLWKVFIASLKISFVSSVRQGRLLNLLKLPKKTIPAKKEDSDKIYRYVYFCLFILRKLGFRYTCYTSSILLCYMLRQAGMGVSVNFGVRKMDRELAGHCWVNEGGEVTTGYQTIFTYP